MKKLRNLRQTYTGTIFSIGLFILSTLGCVPTQQGAGHYLSPGAVDRQQQIAQTGTYYAGYSMGFQPFKQQLSEGRVTDVGATLAKQEVDQGILDDEDKLAHKLRLIGLMERASITLQAGEIEQTRRYCSIAKNVLEDRESESYFEGGISQIDSVFKRIMGKGEYGRYNATGFEKVLLLDLSSIAYLLDGDERAFNEARLAVLWQNDEKEKFEEKLAGVKQEAEEKELKKDAEKSNDIVGLVGKINKEYSKYEDVALTVPNAFVNPFGDYVTGMVNEFKSVKIKSLLSNANIAYKQALELNPNSKVIQQAVKDTANKKPASRLIHVVCLDGFVPEKKVLSIPVYQGFDIELPTYEPVESKVAKVKVTTSGGKVLATLSPVADIEAMALRLQKDALPGVQAMVVAAAIRDIGIIKLGDQIYNGLGNLFRGALDNFQEPDTTSWMSLPSTIMAARIYPPKGLKTIKIRSYNKKGKMLAEKTVKLGDGDRHFVLARSIDSTLAAYPSRKIWTSRSSLAKNP